MKYKDFLLVAALLSINSVIANTQAGDFKGGSGTESNPYQISNRAELDNLRKYLGNNHKDKYYRIIADIDLAGDDWVPVGNGRNNAFHGKLNGGGHKISNLNIGQNGTGYYYTGLFGYLSNGADIDSLHIASGKIWGAGDKSYTGSIAGYAYNSGSGSDVVYIWRCSNAASIWGGDDSESNTGGIVGYAYSESSGYVYVNRRINNGFIRAGNAKSSFTGGIIGRADGYSLGTVRVWVSINNAAISSHGTLLSCTGGIVGFGADKGVLSVQDNKNNGNISGAIGVETNTGGIVGYGHGACVFNYNENNGNVTGKGTDISRTAGIVGRAESSGSNNTIIRFNENWGVIKEEGPLITYTAGILGSGHTAYNGGYVYNTSELIIEKNMNYGNIMGGGTKGSYTGGILGKGSTWNSSSALGLGLFVTIQHCYSQCVIYAGGGCVGGLVGELNTNFSGNAKSNCSLEKCYASGTITGNAQFAGGIIGYTDRLTYIGVKNCASLLTKIQGQVAHRIVGSGSLTLSNNYADKSMLVNKSLVNSNDAASVEGLDKPISDFYKQATYESLGGWDFTNTDDGVWKIRNDNSTFPYHKFQAAPVVPANLTLTGVELNLSEPSDRIYVYRFTAVTGLEYLETFDKPKQGKYTYSFNSLINPADTMAFITFHVVEGKWSPSYPTFISNATGTEIKNIANDNSLVYYNPEAENIIISGCTGACGIVMDMHGRQVYSLTELHNVENVCTMGWNKGVYLVVLQNGENKFTRKVIVM